MIITRQQGTQIFVASFLFTTIATLSMDQLQISTIDKPTIRAQILFDLKTPAFYVTSEQMTSLNEKGICSFAIPIGLHVKKVIVTQNGKRIDWKCTVPEKVRSYENKKLQDLSFGQRLSKEMTINNLIFPQWLPAELAYSCSNKSKISLALHGFPVQATMHSTGIFHKEYTQCLDSFYTQPINQPLPAKADLEKLYKAGILQLDENNAPSTGPEAILSILAGNATSWFTHGPKGCPNESRFVELIIENKVKKQLPQNNRNMCNFVLNRQLGLPSKKIYQKKNPCCESATLWSMSQKLRQDLPKYPSKCGQIEISDNTINHRDSDDFQPNYGRLARAAIDKSRHGDECVLL